MYLISYTTTLTTVIQITLTFSQWDPTPRFNLNRTLHVDITDPNQPYLVSGLAWKGWVDIKSLTLELITKQVKNLSVRCLWYWKYMPAYMFPQIPQIIWVPKVNCLKSKISATSWKVCLQCHWYFLVILSIVWS